MSLKSLLTMIKSEGIIVLQIYIKDPFHEDNYYGRVENLPRRFLVRYVSSFTVNHIGDQFKFNGSPSEVIVTLHP